MATDLLERRAPQAVEARLRWRRLTDDDSDTLRRRERETGESNRRTREEVRHEVDGLHRRDG